MVEIAIDSAFDGSEYPLQVIALHLDATDRIPQQLVVFLMRTDSHKRAIQQPATYLVVEAPRGRDALHRTESINQGTSCCRGHGLYVVTTNCLDDGVDGTA